MSGDRVYDFLSGFVFNREGITKVRNHRRLSLRFTVEG